MLIHLAENAQLQFNFALNSKVKLQWQLLTFNQAYPVAFKDAKKS